MRKVLQIIVFETKELEASLAIVVWTVIKKQTISITIYTITNKPGRDDVHRQF